MSNFNQCATFEVSAKMHYLLELFSMIYSEDKNIDKTNLEAPDEIVKEIGGMFWNDIVRIYDLYVEDISMTFGIPRSQIKGSIGLWGGEFNGSVFYSHHLLPFAKTYDGMNIYNFEIRLNYGLIFLLSELSLTIGAFLLNKIDEITFKRISGNLRNYLIEVQKSDKKNRSDLPSYKYPTMYGDRFILFHIPPTFNKKAIHNLDFWTLQELGLVSDINRFFYSFIIAHEFGHILTASHNILFPPPHPNNNNRFFFLAKNFAERVFKNGYDNNWLEEFVCDSMAIKLFNFSLYDWNPSRIDNVTSILNNNKRINEYKEDTLPLLVAKTLFTGFILMYGDYEISTHPKPSSRIDYLKFFLEYQYKQDISSQIHNKLDSFIKS